MLQRYTFKRVLVHILYKNEFFSYFFCLFGFFVVLSQLKHKFI